MKAEVQYAGLRGAVTIIRMVVGGIDPGKSWGVIMFKNSVDCELAQFGRTMPIIDGITDLKPVFSVGRFDTEVVAVDFNASMAIDHIGVADGQVITVGIEIIGQQV